MICARSPSFRRGSSVRSRSGLGEDAVVRRAAEIADGWMPIMAPNVEAEAKLADLRSRLMALGRDPDTFGLEGWRRMW
jgi:hypothetical protein